MIVQLEELVVKTPSIAECSHALKADVVAKFNELSTYWASISEELVAEKGKAQAAKSIDDVKTNGKNVSAILKKFSQLHRKSGPLSPVLFTTTTTGSTDILPAQWWLQTLRRHHLLWFCRSTLRKR